MPVYVIAQGRTVNRAMHDDYVAKAIPTLEAHGAKILAVTEAPDVIEGTIANPRFVLLEFASREVFQALVRVAGVPGDPAAAARVGSRQPRRHRRLTACSTRSTT